MIDIENLYAMYAKVDPRDRRDLTWFASEDTLRDLIEHLRMQERMRTDSRILRAAWVEPFSPVGNVLFGHPIEVDDNLPYGTFTIGAETEMDRVLRRADRDGVRYNLMKSPKVEWVKHTPPPDPTLKLLIRKWMGRFRR